MTLVTTKIDYNCSCLLTALTLPIQPAQLLKAGTPGYNVLLPFYVTFLFSKFVRPIISTSTVAKFSQLVELWVQMIILKLVFDPSGDVAMTTKFVVLVHGRRWRPAAGGDRYAVAKSPEFRKKFHRSPYFCRWLNFLKIQSRTGRRNPPCQKQINLVIPFDRRTPKQYLKAGFGSEVEIWRHNKEYLISDGPIRKIITYFSDGSTSK